MLTCRFREATHRTTRWLDRCVAAHSRPNEQNLFAIVQGGLDPELRDISLKVTILLGSPSPPFSPVSRQILCEGLDTTALATVSGGTLQPPMWDCGQGSSSQMAEHVTVSQDLKARHTPGYAIGGLAGGEDKESFCR